jgi:hypothetical protein
LYLQGTLSPFLFLNKNITMLYKIMGMERKKSIQYKNPKLSFGAGGNNERSTLLS